MRFVSDRFLPSLRISGHRLTGEGMISDPSVSSPSEISEEVSAEEGLETVTPLPQISDASRGAKELSAIQDLEINREEDRI